MKGSGEYWSGNQFQAHIVDIGTEGEKKDTVKVQYADGGFKRFPVDKFSQLIVESGDADERLDFGTQDYEWAADQYSPAKQLDSELDDLETKLKACINSKDFLGAENVKKLRIERQTHQRLLQQQQAMLLSAVQRQNFVEADAIQKKIEAILANRATQNKNSTKAPPSTLEILGKAKDKAFRGGLAGMSAMALQVGTMMWMRTIMNYQYRHGAPSLEQSTLAH